MRKCTSRLAWRNGRRNGLKIHRWKHHTSSSLVASISHMRHFIPWARMIEVGTKMLNFCIYIRVLCEQHEWHMALPQHRVFTFYKNGLTVSLDIVRAHMYEDTGSIPVQSTRRRKHLIFAFMFCTPPFLNVQSRLLVHW